MHKDLLYVLNAEKRLIGKVLPQEKSRFVHNANVSIALVIITVHIIFLELHL